MWDNANRSRDMNESIRIVKMFHRKCIVFLYCRNDEWIFRVLSFIWYHPVRQEFLFLMVFANLKFIF